MVTNQTCWNNNQRNLSAVHNPLPPNAATVRNRNGKVKPAQKLFFHQSEFLALTKKLVMSALKRERVSSNQVDTSSLSRHTSCFKHQKLIAAQDSVGWKTVQLTHLRLYFSSLVTVVLDFLALVHPDCPPYRTSNSWLSVTELEKKINIHLYWNPSKLHLTF